MADVKDRPTLVARCYACKRLVSAVKSEDGWDETYISEEEAVALVLAGLPFHSEAYCNECIDSTRG